MFYRHLDDNIKTALSIPQFAAELFELTDKNRGYLKTWLPWLDAVKKPGDTEAFLSLQLKRFSAGEALHLTIFRQDKIAGVLGYNQIDPVNGTGHIGYWLGREYTGRGIMTSAVRDLIGLGFENWPLQRVEIRCAVENHKSRAIPERLGFKNEGTIRRAEKVYDTYNDH
ncbi:MAG: GNAT family N-acetyltransferase, partial [Desulfobacterales bacterium]|nr:GNAT family N-acetyltransferase [Desulfobacterales bacterium]